MDLLDLQEGLLDLSFALSVTAYDISNAVKDLQLTNCPGSQRMQVLLIKAGILFSSAE